MEFIPFKCTDGVEVHVPITYSSQSALIAGMSDCVQDEAQQSVDINLDSETLKMVTYIMDICKHAPPRCSALESEEEYEMRPLSDKEVEQFDKISIETLLGSGLSAMKFMGCDDTCMRMSMMYIAMFLRNQYDHQDGPRFQTVSGIDQDTRDRLMDETAKMFPFLAVPRFVCHDRAWKLEDRAYNERVAAEKAAKEATGDQMEVENKKDKVESDEMEEEEVDDNEEEEDECEDDDEDE